MKKTGKMRLMRFVGIIAVIMLIGSQMAMSAFAGTGQRINYQEQSKDVTVNFDTSLTTGKFIAYYNIGENADGNQVIDLSKVMSAFNEYAQKYGYESYPALPGDKNQVQIVIRNNSKHTYQYQDGSFSLATANTSQFDNLTKATGFDGQKIPFLFTGALAKSIPIQKLFGVSNSGKITVDMLCGIYEQLEKKGFKGDNALTDYIMDYYKVTSPDQLTAGQKVEIQGGMANAQFQVNKAKADQLKKDYPRTMDSAMITKKSNGDYEIQLKWPETRLAAMSYNFFYDSLFGFGFGPKVKTLESAGNTTPLEMAIADYMNDKNGIWTETNEYFKSLTNSEDKLLTSDKGSDLTIDMLLAIDGPNTNNAYQKYSLSWYNSIVLEQTDAQNYKTGQIEITKKVTENGKPYKINTTFYAGLFEDQACTKPVTDADNKPIIIPLDLKDQDSVTVTKDQIPYGDFYVAETDKDGKALQSSEGIKINIDNPKVTISGADTPRVTITNEYSSQYYMTGQAEITKKVTENGKPYQVSTTFYAGLFDDEACTKLTADADGKPIIIPLELKNQDSVTVTKDQIPYGSFYVAETDKDGKVVSSSEGHKITVDNPKIEVAEGNTPKAVITNDYGDYEGFYKENDGNTANTTTTTTTKVDTADSDTEDAVQTGDDSSIVPYVVLLLLAAGAAAAVVFVKKKKKN